MTTKRHLITSALLQEATAPGLSEGIAHAMIEASAICLDSQHHPDPVDLQLEGISQQIIELHWTYPITERLQRAWREETEATEMAAAGIASLLIPEVTEFCVVGRSVIGTGFDIWLGPKGNQSDALFGHTARLEVSGIRQGSETDIQTRLRAKFRQTKRSAGALPAYVIIVEFGTPLGWVSKQDEPNTDIP